MKKAALLVGINQYHFGNPLMAPAKDAREMTELLSKHHDGSSNFDCKLLTCSHYPDKKITRERLHKEIEEFFDKDEKQVRTAIFFFAGHGCESNLGGYLMTQDSRNFIGGVSVNDILICANNSRIPNIIIILDCCHAGYMGTIPSLKSEMISLRNGITVLSSSNKHQTSIENLEGGLFTQSLIFALNGEGADITGNVDPISMYTTACKFLQKKKQNPTLKTSIVNFPVIRKAKPRIPESEMEQLTSLFVNVDQHKPLNGRYLKEGSSTSGSKTQELALLKKMKRYDLVQTPDDKSLNEVAKESLKCQLTEAGKFRFHQMTPSLLKDKQ